MTVKDLALFIEQTKDLTVFGVNDGFSIETHDIAVRQYGNQEPEWYVKSENTPDGFRAAFDLLPINFTDIKKLQALLAMPSVEEYECLKERLHDEY